MGGELFSTSRMELAPDEDRYSSAEEIKAALAEEPDAAVLVASAIWAIGTYNPITEAIVVESIGDVIRVLIVRQDDAEEVGGIQFSPTTTP
jgi:hypothetical protein